MSKLEPGMLAIIVGSVHDDSPHVGKTVTLKDKGYLEMLGEFWNIEEPLSFDAWRVLSKHLLPIKPEADPLETKQEQELHA